MKKLLIYFFIAMVSVVMVSCDDDDIIVDWAPVCLYIYAEDAQGNDLIKPEMQGMTLTYDNEVYTVKSQSDEALTKAYMPYFFGLCFKEGKKDPNNNSDKNYLIFGELDGAADMDKDILLTWPDGSTNIIHYHCSDHNTRKISCKRTWKLDGKTHDGHVFKFVK